MPPGQNTSTAQNFPFLPNLDGQQLNIKVELGVLYIPPRNPLVQNLVPQYVNNPFHPNPGGKQGESFVNNTTLKQYKSANLKVVSHGIMPSHLDISGAPYCTFIEGSLTSQSQHPYYNLITAPQGEGANIQFSGQANFSIQTPLIQQNFYSSVNTITTQQFNKLGTPFIPPTTLTSNAVASANPPNLTTYNIWQIDNLGTSQSSYFDLIEFLGYVPKSGTQAANLQPYAQTWPFTDTAQIQVYASNSQVSLTRKYPICKDYAHDPQAQYLIYNNGALNSNSVGLSNPNQAVGFTLMFSSVVVSNTIPVGSSENTVLTEPRMIISWGALGNPNKYTIGSSGNKISLYTLEISPNRPPRIYFNISAQQILNQNVDPNHNFVELNNLKQIQATQRNSGAKTPNDYKLFVYYSGAYLYIGAGDDGHDPSTWQTVNAQTLQISNSSDNYLTAQFDHYLDADSQVNITAQFMNFTYAYGPPLFNPHDDQNLPGLTFGDPSANSYNFASGQTFISTTDPIPDPNTINSFITQNQKLTFETIDESNSIFGGASAYIDSRAVNPQFTCAIQEPPLTGNINSFDYNQQILKYKMTMPQDLGGHVFNKAFSQDYIPMPKINSSYVVYLTDQFPEGSIESILTQSVLSGFRISKKIDIDAPTFLTSTLSIKFLNLNRFASGNEILQFMRHNVCVLKISAGYGNNFYTYFEGMVRRGVEAEEYLDRSEFAVQADDLMSSLFVDPELCIVSRNKMVFPGMIYQDIINFIAYYTELNGHFAYDLSPQLVNYISKTYLPRKFDTLINPQLSTLVINPYDSHENYFKVINTICGLSLQPNNPPSIFDIPILYWYVDSANDGIIMSSRKQQQNKDQLFFRKNTITDELTTDINSLHGYILMTGEPFKSVSNTDLLQAVGLYRFMDIDNVWQSVYVQNPSAFNLSTPSQGSSYGYIGYNRITVFDNPAQNQGQSVFLNSALMADYNAAYTFVSNWMNAVYETVYEGISLPVIVTKPLKEYGFFTICVENDSNEIPEEYLYDQVEYTFNLDHNIITANISGSKKAISNI